MLDGNNTLPHTLAFTLASPTNTTMFSPSLLLVQRVSGAAFLRSTASAAAGRASTLAFSSNFISTETPKYDLVHPPPLNKSIFRKLRDKYSIRGQQERIEIGERLFRAAQTRATHPIWFGPGRIGRVFRPRHAMLTMHIWFLHKRLIEDSVDPHFSLLVQEELFDVLWYDTTIRIRAEGVNELTVNKHLKDVQQVTFAHLCHYDHAYQEFANDDVERMRELKELVWMHIMNRDEEASPDVVERLAVYVDMQYKNIVEQLPHQYFRQGRIPWTNIPDFKGLRDHKGDIMEAVPIFEEDILPEGWQKGLTNSGDAYYWNAELGTSSWEKPKM
jgi:cytochrome b pre-mRNA-processing protein 3